MKELKALSYALIYSSPVYFYTLAEKYKKEHTENRDLGWLEWPGAMEVFSLGKRRIFDAKGNKNMEIMPKWEAFRMLVSEVKEISKTDKIEKPKLMIIAKDYRSYATIKKLLVLTPEELTKLGKGLNFNLFLKYFHFF